jgi:protein-tyrosine phosphatase
MGPGRRVAPGRLFRAEAIGLPGSGAESVWDETQADAYRSLGLHTVIDLRSEQEAALIPTAWGHATGARVLRAPIPEGVEGSDTDFMRMLFDGTIARFDQEDLGRWYQRVLDRRAGVLGAVVRELAAPGSLPALVHCHAGKDRTGLVVAVILETSGVPRDLVVADYALTGEFRPDRAAVHAADLKRIRVRLEDVRAFWEAPARAMESALEHLDLAYGGAETYLTQACGVTPEQIQSLRRALLEEE